jgi:hypothetical protein
MKSLLLFIFSAIALAAAGSILDEEKGNKDRRGQCPEEEAIEVVRRIVKQWPDYVNTGNQKFLIKNWMTCDASITETGSPLDSFCQTMTSRLAEKLREDRLAKILSETVNIKRIRMNGCDENVIANFVLASGHRGFNLSLSNESWIFTSKCGCDYRVSEAVSVKLECVKQENNCPIPY